MATYVISDIHGCFKTFIALLEKINFNDDNDELYILGDIIDRGEGSFEMYEWVKSRYNKNVFMILGNHEEMFNENIRLMKKERMYDNFTEKDKTKLFKEMFKDLAVLGYDHYGTIRKLLKHHSADDILEMSEFFEDLPLYYEVTVNDMVWTLVHACCSEDLEETSKDTFIWDRGLAYYGVGIKGKNIVFGHTPTICAEYDYVGGIQYEKGELGGEDFIKINIDCGCVWKKENSKLAILRLDDMKDFYQDNVE